MTFTGDQTTGLMFTNALTTRSPLLSDINNDMAEFNSPAQLHQMCMLAGTLATCYFLFFKLHLFVTYLSFPMNMLTWLVCLHQISTVSEPCDPFGESGSSDDSSSNRKQSNKILTKPQSVSSSGVELRTEPTLPIGCGHIPENDVVNASSGSTSLPASKACISEQEELVKSAGIGQCCFVNVFSWSMLYPIKLIITACV